MTQEPAQKPRKKFGWVRPLAAIGILLLIGYYLYKPFKEDLSKLKAQEFSLKSIRYQWLGVCLTCLMGVRLINAMNCRIILSAFGKTVPVKRVISIIWTASLGRYIPGKVLAAGAVWMFVKIGVDWSTTLAALGLSVAMMILMSLVFGLPSIYFEPIKSLSPIFQYPIILSAIGACFFGLFLHPSSFVRIANFFLKLMKRPQLPARIHFPTLLKAFGISAVKLLLFGIALYSACRSWTDLSIKHLPMITSVSALASFGGFAVFVVPAGFGVHEWFYNTLLRTLIPVPFVPIILYRIMNLLADAILGLIGLGTLDLSPIEKGE